jgi:hypothetical protein
MSAPFLSVSVQTTKPGPHWTQRPEFLAARRAGDQSRIEYWMYLTACYVVNVTEPMAREIAEIALRERCGVWHATWIYRGRQPGHCGCANCLPGVTKFFSSE